MGDSLYALSSNGDLVSIQLATGEVVVVGILRIHFRKQQSGGAAHGDVILRAAPEVGRVTAVGGRRFSHRVGMGDFFHCTLSRVP